MLKGQKVVLREKRWEDAVEDYEWRRDEELARLDAAQPLKASYNEYLFDHATELTTPSDRRKRFAIDTMDGTHIGNCMFYDIDKKKGQAELGIMIGVRDYWQKGYGTDTITLLLNHIFSSTSLNRVYLKTLDWNVRAQACFGKCGFVPYGKTRACRNTFVNMEITREDWERRVFASPRPDTARKTSE